MPKRSFDIDEIFRRLREATARYARAALFQLAAEGHTSAFEQLVACIISVRTRDETMLPVARRLFASARTPATLAALPLQQVDELIRDSAFHRAKAENLLEIARRIVAEHEGDLPCDEAVMLGFRGVGPKCANLVMGIACGAPRIGVDIHVHRVTNRWGYVHAPTPEATMAALQRVLPERYFVEINERLVPFGKHICTGRAPKCSTCPLVEFCRQVGVTEHR